MNKRKVPKIRFKGFHDDWEQRKLGDLLVGVSEKNSDGQYSQDDILACSLGTELDKKTIFFGLRSTEESVKSYRKVKIGDVIYTKSPIKGYPNGIVRTCKIADGIVPSLYCVYKKRDDISVQIDTRFIQSYLEEKGRLDQYLYPLVNVGARNNVNITDKEFLEGNILMPPQKEEQTKIVESLEKITNLITLHQRKLEKLKIIKKSMLENCFSKSGEKVPKIRFSGFSDDWEQRKLGDIVDVRSGKDYKHLSEGNIPVYGTGGYMLSVNQALSYDEDAIGIGRKGTIDKPYILKAPFWTVDTLFYAIPREKVDLNFAFDVFQNIDWKKKDESTGVPSLSKIAINEIDVLVPQYDEQQSLGQFFYRIDNLITLHQSKLEKLKMIKKSMLETMFV